MLLIIFSLLFGFPVHPVHPSVLRQPASIVLQDSLPPLHTLKGKNISKIETSFEMGTIQVTMLDGRVLLYRSADWDYEDYYPEIDPKLKAAIQNVKKTFTKAEKMPEFPGQQEGWDTYLRNFCQKHREEIQSKGPATIRLSFIVHCKGQVSDLEVLLNQPDAQLADLAMDCIRSGPTWQPAFQNGRVVPCRVIQVVKLGVE